MGEFFIPNMDPFFFLSQFYENTQLNWMFWRLQSFLYLGFKEKSPILKVSQCLLTII